MLAYRAAQRKQNQPAASTLFSVSAITQASKSSNSASRAQAHGLIKFSELSTSRRAVSLPSTSRSSSSTPSTSSTPLPTVGFLGLSCANATAIAPHIVRLLTCLVSHLCLIYILVTF